MIKTHKYIVLFTLSLITVPSYSLNNFSSLLFRKNDSQFLDAFMTSYSRTGAMSGVGLVATLLLRLPVRGIIPIRKEIPTIGLYIIAPPFVSLGCVSIQQKIWQNNNFLKTSFEEGEKRLSGLIGIGESL